VRCTRTGRSTIKDFDESATRPESPGDTETDDAGTNDGDLWFADAKEAVGQESGSLRWNDPDRFYGCDLSRDYRGTPGRLHK
jgi:hypothetical protein